MNAVRVHRGHGKHDLRLVRQSCWASLESLMHGGIAQCLVNCEVVLAFSADGSTLLFRQTDPAEAVLSTLRFDTVNIFAGHFARGALVVTLELT